MKLNLIYRNNDEKGIFYFISLMIWDTSNLGSYFSIRKFELTVFFLLLLSYIWSFEPNLIHFDFNYATNLKKINLFLFYFFNLLFGGDPCTCKVLLPSLTVLYLYIITVSFTKHMYVSKKYVN